MSISMDSDSEDTGFPRGASWLHQSPCPYLNWNEFVGSGCKHPGFTPDSPSTLILLAQIPVSVVSSLDALADGDRALARTVDQRNPIIAPLDKMSTMNYNPPMKSFEDYRIAIPAGYVGQYRTTCPECSHSRKKQGVHCLSVNIDEGVWNCKHCGWAGSLHEEFVPPVVQRKSPNKIKPIVEKHSMPVWAEEFFLSRGISQNTLIANKVTGGVEYIHEKEAEVPVVGFVYYKDGEICNVKYRDEDKNFIGVKGAERCLYGYDHIKNNRVIIVEGEMDKLALWEAGHHSCVSVPDGAPAPNTKNYSSKFTFLDDPKLDAVEDWIIAVDSDAPGKKLEHELARRLGLGKCSRVVWPSDCKDANDVLMKHGREALDLCIQSREPFPVKGTFSANDLEEDVIDLYRNGMERGVSTGWKSLDPFLKIRPGLLTVVTGVPNSGKSNWVDDLMINLAENEGWRFAIFSPENQPIKDHVTRMIEKRVRVPFDFTYDVRMTEKDLLHGNKWVGHYFTWILPDDDSEWTLDNILDTARVLVQRKGINGLVIDPWNELEHMRPPHMTETEYISICLKKMRHFARQNSISLIIVAHPAKLYRGQDGKFPVPDLYSISGSAHWKNKSDNGVVIWRDLENPQDRRIQVHIQKVRFRQDGRLGVADLVYCGVTGKYKNVGDNTPMVSPYEETV